MNEELKQLIFRNKHSRTIPIPPDAINKDNRTITMSFSSEAPVVRWWGIEVLNHSPECVRQDRMKLGAPYLMDHDPGDQRGRIEPFVLSADRCTRGDVKISRHPRGEELWMDHMDGIRKETSIGYQIHGAREMDPMEMNDDLKTLALQEGLPVYDINDWEPIEGSSVSMPADTTVGAGRSLEYNDRMKEDEIKALLKKINERSEPHNQGRNITMPEPIPAPAVTTTPHLSPEVLARMENERVEQIKSMGEKYKDRIRTNVKMDELVRDAIDLKVPVEDFRGAIYRAVNDTQAVDTPDTFLDMSDKDKKRYSLRKAIMTQVKGEKEEAGLEREASEEIRKRIGQAPRGLYVPRDIQMDNRELPIGLQLEINRLCRAYGIKTNARALTVGTATAGGNLVATNLQAGNFIELLRNRLVAAKFGVEFMPGLVGNVAFPKQTGASTFYWVAENSNLTTSAPTFGQVTLSPKSGGGYVDFSRQLLLQATPAVDMLVMSDLVKVSALGVDKSVFHGAGANNEPKGIINVTGIGSNDGTDFGWTTAVQLETDVAKANADVETMNYVMNATTRGALKTRPKLGGTFPVFLVENNEMNGYPVLMSNQINDGYIFFGDGAQTIVGEWGVLDLLVDPYTGGIAGTIRVISFISIDVGVRQAVAYSTTPSFT